MDLYTLARSRVVCLSLEGTESERKLLTPCCVSSQRLFIAVVTFKFRSKMSMSMALRFELVIVAIVMKIKHGTRYFALLAGRKLIKESWMKIDAERNAKAAAKQVQNDDPARERIRSVVVSSTLSLKPSQKSSNFFQLDIAMVSFPV